MFVSGLLRPFYAFVGGLWQKIGAFLYKSAYEADLRDSVAILPLRCAKFVLSF